jgi:UDP-GlcNAc:undecaprenyl-phosphate GlcNAc-1-phosphate transferase
MPYIIFFTAFVISFITVPLVISFANNSGAIALPGTRHVHLTPTPKFGGLSIAFSVIIVLFIAFPVNRVIASYLVASGLMLALGAFDDIRGSNWKLKLVFSLAATSIIIFGAGIWIRSLGNLFGGGEVVLGLWGIPFTYFAIFGVVSAINLIDGLNGLACGISSIAFISFAIFGYIDANNTVFYLSLVNLGATMGLFRYNYPRARIFMGDTGSLFLGFSIAVITILLTQDSGGINQMVPVIVLGIPLFDTLRVLIIRLKNKKHPFEADKTHLHHLMMRSGIPPKRVVKVIWLLSCLMSLLAFVLHVYPAWLMLVVFFIVVTLIGVFIENLRVMRLKGKRNIAGWR